jgi:hypothetical protein
VPDVAPLATPVPNTIVATKELLLLHVPPKTALLMVVDKPTQVVVAPMIPEGAGLTVTALVAAQPPGIVYVMVADPEERPDTNPVFTSTAATIVLLLLHVPPGEESLKKAPVPRHILVVPEMEVGDK